ncbi:MAG: uracil-DNA glycosylase [SAR202 cluster bacterium]|nr:uracil-DNA glycosylase [SAR202 cluster bacterium]
MKRIALHSKSNRGSDALSPAARQQLAALQSRIIRCKKCPRLVAHRQAAALQIPPRYAGWDYWARPLPSFGGPNARLLILGLAPAAHGGNRTGRMFTGDRSGDWVYGTLHKFGFAAIPTSDHKDDGQRLIDAYITAALHCAPPLNKPTPEELANCQPYLLNELKLLKNVRVVVTLGKIAFDAYLAACAKLGIEIPKPRPKFGHAAAYTMPNGVTLIGSYHPSQQNTFTGKLTRPMFEGIFSEARHLINQP